MMKPFLYLVSLLLFLAGCKTPVYLNRTNPPELVLDKQPATIVFSNHFDFLANPGIKDKHEVAYQTAIEEFGRALTMTQPEAGQVVFFVTDSTTAENHKDHLFEENVAVGRIQDITLSYDGDYLLVLDSLRLHFDWEVVREENPEGSVSKTKDFYLISNYYVTLYDATGEVTKRTLLGRSLLYTSRPTLGALITILPNLANATEKIRILARDAAMEYSAMFYPSEERIGQRELFTGKAFAESNALIQSGRYDEAIRILQELSANSKPKLALKAVHNLEVASELKMNNLGKDFLRR
jgi:hypothetical protein